MSHSLASSALKLSDPATWQRQIEAATNQIISTFMLHYFAVRLFKQLCINVKDGGAMVLPHPFKINVNSRFKAENF
jgi:ABC-type uncharacterized transport system permease subunit